VLTFILARKWSIP